MGSVKRALISVYDKRGVEELGRALAARGVEILSSGGTAARLAEAGVAVTPVDAFTGSPEVLGGRVKTLHPKIHGGILARATPEHEADLQRIGAGFIDLVVVNLYPFVETIARPDVTPAEAVEQIDIGGPAMVRAAAKNHERVAVVVDPADYGRLLEAMDEAEGAVPEALRRELAARAFAATAAYDAAIAGYLATEPGEPLPAAMPLVLGLAQRLRYGENPHQAGAFYEITGGSGPQVSYEKLQGKSLSYNNILDCDAAWNLVRELPETAVVAIKHTNPCGAAWREGAPAAEVFRLARATDPVSIFGGIVAANVPVDGELAEELRSLFLEAVVAPAFTGEARQVLRRKRKLRLLVRRDAAGQGPEIQLRSAWGGILAQPLDRAVEEVAEARVVTRRAPTEAELRDLDFAWRVCKHVKSNAIVLARGGQLVGVGAGQMSRVDSVKLAATKAVLPREGSVLASDAFFPFRDGLDAAVEAGATAVVQPGGSIRDEEVIAAADEHGVAMVFTGVRHFRH